ncbi:flagellar protein FliT [Rossellomorea aquimaris]|uniref:Flagellar protein FliT n=1 Tax=Rossellomorea aquimaris TaxID=189382 RepID=A0A5D4U8Q1_9BACI|nr:flagellar protein FliT [Rossellomorea aquimaris]TYS76851.1 flagellar protein FliT [Rossellomorea aquimaris]TYS83756.1 flagellar protein FliT [Rossellomorea aquimaris]
MSSVLLCYTITKQLKQALEQATDENRESTIEEVESLLEKRQSVLGTINPPYTQDEQELGKQMIAWNQQIDRQLAQLRLEIKRDMNGLTKKKTSVQKYSNPYESLQYDGMFYDKKK